MWRKLVRLAALAGVAVAGCAMLAGTGGALRVGRPAPPAEGVDGEGRFFRLADYPGRVVVVSFWGSFCGPCRALFPREKALVEKYRDKPFVLLGVNVDADAEEFRKAQAAHGLTWRSWFDGPDGPIARQFGVNCYPTVFVIDHTGVIRFRSEGAPDPRAFDALVKRLVRELPPEPVKS